MIKVFDKNNISVWVQADKVRSIVSLMHSEDAYGYGNQPSGIILDIEGVNRSIYIGADNTSEAQDMADTIAANINECRQKNAR